MDQNQLYDALEYCLQALEQGEEIDSALTEYPGLAKTLRPLLENSILARAHAVLTVPDQAFFRGQIKLSKQLEKIQSDEPRQKTTLPFPSIIHSFKHTWNGILLSFFINRNMHRVLEISVKKNFLQCCKNDKKSKEDNHVSTHRS